MPPKYSNKEVFTLSSVSCIMCETIYNLVCIFLDTFLVARILSLKDYDLYYIGLFYFVHYSTRILFNIVLNYLVKKLKLNYFVTIGAVILVGLVMGVYFLGDTALIAYLPLLAVGYALGAAFFWLGQNNLATVAVSSRYQVRFFTVKRTVIVLIKVLTPLVLGSSISAMGFDIVAVIMVVFTVLLFIFSLFVKPNKKIEMHFKPIKFFKVIVKEKKKRNLLLMNYLTAFFYGLAFTGLSTMFTYLVYKVLQGDFELGIAKTASNAISLILMLIFLKFYRKRHAKWYLFIPMIIYPILTVVMFFITNVYTILLMYMLFNLFLIVPMSLFDTRRSGIIRMLDMHEYVLEHIALNEVSISLSLIIGFALFMIPGINDNNGAVFIIVFSVLMLAFIGLSIAVYFTEKMLIQQDKEWKAQHASSQTVEQVPTIENKTE